LNQLKRTLFAMIRGSGYFHFVITNALQEVMPERPFRPIDKRIACSLICSISLSCSSDCSTAIDVSARLRAVATASLSGTT